jgi:hypothetical protein|tara:strand:+ start:478 stop:645 length:168 start_codon:yes stop_codon:yes gene_type:complete
MAGSRKCRECGGLDELMYELDSKPIYYCATCDKETDGSGAELIGPDERLAEEAGE